MKKNDCLMQQMQCKCTTTNILLLSNCKWKIARLFSYHLFQFLIWRLSLEFKGLNGIHILTNCLIKEIVMIIAKQML